MATQPPASSDPKKPKTAGAGQKPLSTPTKEEPSIKDGISPKLRAAILKEAGIEAGDDEAPQNTSSTVSPTSLKLTTFEADDEQQAADPSQPQSADPRHITLPTDEEIHIAAAEAEEHDRDIEENNRIPEIENLLSQAGFLAGAVNYNPGKKSYTIDLPANIIAEDALVNYDISKEDLKDMKKSELVRWYVPAQLIEPLAATNDARLEALRKKTRKEDELSPFDFARLTKFNQKFYVIDGMDAEIQPESIFPSNAPDNLVYKTPIVSVSIAAQKIDEALQAEELRLPEIRKLYRKAAKQSIKASYQDNPPGYMIQLSQDALQAIRSNPIGKLLLPSESRTEESEYACQLFLPAVTMQAVLEKAYPGKIKISEGQGKQIPLQESSGRSKVSQGGETAEEWMLRVRQAKESSRQLSPQQQALEQLKSALGPKVTVTYDATGGGAGALHISAPEDFHLGQKLMEIGFKAAKPQLTATIPLSMAQAVLKSKTGHTKT